MMKSTPSVFTQLMQQALCMQMCMEIETGDGQGTAPLMKPYRHLQKRLDEVSQAYEQHVTRVVDAMLPQGTATERENIRAVIDQHVAERLFAKHFTSLTISPEGKIRQKEMMDESCANCAKEMAMLAHTDPDATLCLLERLERIMLMKVAGIMAPARPAITAR